MKCDICNLTVAPHDREQMRIGKKVVHQSCFKRHLQRVSDGKLQVQEVIEEADILEREILRRNEWPDSIN